MAITFSNDDLIKRDRQDYRAPTGRRVVLSAITMDTDYLDGGYVVSAALFGLTTLEKVYPFAIAVTGADGANFGATWDQTAGKIKIFNGSDGIEATTGDNALSGMILQVIAVGT